MSTNEAAERLRDSITEVLHRYECDDEPPGHDWHEHLPWDEKPHHPNRIDGLVDLFAAERRATVERIRAAILAAYCKVKHGNTHPTGCGSYNAEAIADEVARAILDEEAAR